MSADEIHDLDWERWTRLHPDQVDDVRAAWDAALQVGEANGVRENARLGTSVLVQQFLEFMEHQQRNQSVFTQQLGVFMERLERLASRLNEDEAGSPYWRSH
jgi:hypothetical protein